MTGRVPGLEPLEPPPGGLADLRRRIGRHERRRLVRRRVAGGLAAALLVVAAGLAAGRALAPRPLPGALAGRLEAIRAGLVEPPAEPVSVPADRRVDVAVARLDADDDRVAYYLVGTR